MKKMLILGAAGFLGSHLEHRLKQDGHFVVSVARHQPLYRPSVADEFLIMNLTAPPSEHAHFFRYDFNEVYQMASETGGLGYIATGDNDVDILTNSLKINMNTLEAMLIANSRAKIFFASSQCVYPDKVEIDPYAQERICSHQFGLHRESDASFDTFAFGQEKMFAEKLYDAYARNYGFDVRIGRIGNTYGPFCTWQGDRAKAPAAICRKVAETPYAGVVELWGDGNATRSFTYVDDTIEGIIRLMRSGFDKPLNIASPLLVSINHLFKQVAYVSGRIMASVQVPGPVGVKARGSDNRLCREVLGWEPRTTLLQGLAVTYPWIKEQLDRHI